MEQQQDTTPMTPGEVESIRMSLGIYKHEFAKLLGVSERTARGWEKGDFITDASTVTLRLVKDFVQRRPSSKLPIVDQLRAVLADRAGK